MNRHTDFDQLQDYREGLLSPEEREAIRVHLRECPVCTEDLAALTDLMEGLAELPVEAEPGRDLWPQIEWRIGGSDSSRESHPSQKNVTVKLWQLMAASITVALISGGAVWSIMAGSSQSSIPSVTGAASMAQPASLDFGYEGYDTVLIELEEVLEQGRGILDPETLQVLEENLTVIDRAIAESRAALAQDPGSRILRRMLSETMRRKMDLLQQVATVIYANT